MLLVSDLALVPFKMRSDCETYGYENFKWGTIEKAARNSDCELRALKRDGLTYVTYTVCVCTVTITMLCDRIFNESVNSCFLLLH